MRSGRARSGAGQVQVQQRVMRAMLLLLIVMQCGVVWCVMSGVGCRMRCGMRARAGNATRAITGSTTSACGSRRRRWSRSRTTSVRSASRATPRSPSLSSRPPPPPTTCTSSYSSNTPVRLRPAPRLFCSAHFTSLQLTSLHFHCIRTRTT